MWGALLLLLILGLLGLLIFPIMFLTYPNVYVGQNEVSFQTRSALNNWLQKANETPVKIKLGDQVQQFTYQDLGVKFDLLAVEKAVIPPRQWAELPNLVKEWIDAWQQTRMVPAFASFETFFESEINRLNGEKETIPDAISYDSNTQVFDYKANNASYRIDIDDLKMKIINSFGKEWGVIEPNYIRSVSKVEEMVEANNAQVQRVFADGVEVVVKDRMGESRFHLTAELLKQMTKLQYDTESWKLKVAVDLQAVKDYLAKAFGERGLVVPEELSLRKASQSLASVVGQRFEGVERAGVVLGVDDGPNSDGSEAAQFIEVDLSQQKMYLWKGGRMERSYQVSTGLYYPTPTGEYAIMNKADNAFSAIFGVYMPFWMAFNYQNDIGAYVGIHELPYKLVNGLKVYRFGNYIGSKKTGGCVALNPGEAKEVYDWANVGTRVRIFD